MTISRTLLAVSALTVPLVGFGSDDVRKLEPVVVTPSRAPILADHVNQSLTVITREDIERRQAIHVAELLRDVPGLAVTRAGALGSQVQVRVRGAESNQVLVMIDGIEANDPASSDDFRFEHLTTADIERIEIVRGPQSALWGTDALAGVINIITRSGGGATRGAVFAETGSHGTVNAGADLGFDGQRLRGHVGVTHFATDGTNISRTGDEADGADTTTLTARLSADLGDSAQVDALYRRVEASSDIDGIDYVLTGLPTDAPLANDLTRDYLQLRGGFDSLDGRLSQSLTFNLLDTANENLLEGVTTDSSGARKTMFRYQMDWSFDPRQRLTAALDHERIDFEQRGTATPYGDPNQDQRTEATGLVLEYVGSSDQWDWNASVRHDRHSDFQDVDNYQAAAGYRISDKLRIRAAVATGRKAPTFTERFGYFSDVFIGNPDLTPEESRSFELGFDYRLPAGRVELTLFQQDLDNEINGFVFDPDSFLFTARNESGRSDRSGLELGGEFELSSAWRMTGSYTYTDATEPVAPSLPGSPEVDEIRRPRHMAHLNLNWQPMDGDLTANLNLSYNGSRDDLFFPPYPQPSTTVSLPGYLLVDLTGRWQATPHLDLFARINNLGDEDYEDVYGFATAGRTFMAGFRYRFDQ